jgi:hypothetical protein
MPSVVLYLVHEPQLKDLFERAQNWPEHAQARLVQVALEIETDLSGAYEPSSDELRAIDEADQSGVATEDEVRDAFAAFRRA